MKDLETLEAFLGEHRGCSAFTFEEGETVRLAVERFAEAFLLGQNGHAEGVLCNSLCDPRMSVRFSALFALLKAQKMGRKLQDETLKALVKFRQSRNCHDLMVMRAAEKKFKQEDLIETRR